MRVVAGDYRGRRLVAPPGDGTRPTSDRVREALFSILGDLRGVDVLDLFAGSGALGVEALSRGAASATFVEHAKEALAAIAANTAFVNPPGRVRVVARDWSRALGQLAAEGKRFGLCLVDPPYALLTAISPELGPEVAPLLVPGARLAIEYAAGTTPVDLPHLEVAGRTDRTYGGTGISVLTIGEAA